MKTITFFRRKLSKLHTHTQNKKKMHVTITFALKQGEQVNKQWTYFNHLSTTYLFLYFAYKNPFLTFSFHLREYCVVFPDPIPWLVIVPRLFPPLILGTTPPPHQSGTSPASSLSKRLWKPIFSTCLLTRLWYKSPFLFSPKASSYLVFSWPPSFPKLWNLSTLSPRQTWLNLTMELLLLVFFFFPGDLYCDHGITLE